jgi:hypothetical protein
MRYDRARKNLDRHPQLHPRRLNGLRNLTGHRYEQAECRVLMKFFWQLAMTYQEVTESDLDRHVQPGKREVIQNLIDAIRNHRKPSTSGLTTHP